MIHFSSDELAFLEGIHATPMDDTIRLVYADWLEEHDQPEYAEFIRFQVEFDSVGNEIYDDLVERGMEIFKRMKHLRPTWAEPAPQNAQLHKFVRGLPVYMLPQFSSLDERLMAIREYSPRSRFWLSETIGHFAEMEQLLATNRVFRLTVYAARRVIPGPLGNNSQKVPFTIEDIKILHKLPHLDNLESLAISKTSSVWPEEVNAACEQLLVAKHPHLFRKLLA